ANQARARNRQPDTDPVAGNGMGAGGGGAAGRRRSNAARRFLRACVAAAGLLFASDATAAAEKNNPREAAAERVIRVGVLVDNTPFSHFSSEGEIEGFTVDLLAGIERAMGLTVERVTGPTREINQAFVEGRLDLLQSYARSSAREDHADFSVPYLEMAGSLFVRRGLPEITTLADLRGRRVAVHTGSLGERLLRTEGLADSIVIADSVEDALRRVDAGEADATLVARLTGLASIHRLQLRNVAPQGPPVPGYDVDYCFAVRKGDTKLLAKVNEGLAVMKRTGEFDRIYRRWFGHVDQTKFSAFDIAVVIAAGLALALLVMIWALVRQRRLRRRIAEGTEALRASEERLRLSTELAHVAVWEYRFASNTMERSPNHDRLYGLPWQTPWEMETFLKATHPDDRAPSSEKIQKAVTPGGPDNYTFDFRVVYPDQSVHWLAVVGQVVERTGEGRGEVVRGCLMDITARKQAEEQLAASELRYRRLFESAKDGILILDAATGMVVDVNPFLVQLLGYSHEAFLGKKVWELGFLRDIVANEANFVELQQQEYIRYENLPLETSDGRRIEAEFVSNVYQVNSQKVIQCNIRDITDRVRAEAALRASEDRYRDLVEHSQDLICTHDLQGKLLSVNLTAARVLGYSVEEIGTMNLRDLLAPGVRRFFGEYLRRVRRDGFAVGELVVRTRSGERRTWEYANSLRREGLSVPIVRGMARDITERKQAEQKLAESREQLRALAARLQSIREAERTRIAREIHDVLGQLLTGLKMDLNSMERHAAKVADAALSGLLAGKAISAAALADELIDTVQQISSDLRPSILDNIGLPAAVRFEARRFAERHGTACEVIEAPESLEIGSERATGVFRVLQEILTNVARHAGATRVEIRLSGRDGELVLAVQDDGRGIDSDALESEHSLGLLSMSERARIMGGRVEISGRAGLGTVVTLTIPAGDSKPEGA
ncbi:MAG: PAS domain S-box protein, partial [Candidatus Didemnitutus sp.]|nr:PAS domain S-box protein [Candidatus Didemnitutus sp.]